MVVNKISSLCLAGTKNVMWIAIPLLVIGISCVWINIHDPVFFNAITEWMGHHLMAFRLFRWGMLFSVIKIFPYFVLSLGKHLGASAEQISKWRKESWRIGAWLIIVELLVCENIVSKTLNLLRGL